MVTRNVMRRLGLIRLHTAFFWVVCVSITYTSLPRSGLPSHRKRSGRPSKCLLSYNSGKTQRSSILDIVCFCDPRDAHCVTSYDYGHLFLGSTAREDALFSFVRVHFWHGARIYVLVVSGYTWCIRLTKSKAKFLYLSSTGSVSILFLQHDSF